MMGASIQLPRSLFIQSKTGFLDRFTVDGLCREYVGATIVFPCDEESPHILCATP